MPTKTTKKPAAKKVAAVKASAKKTTAKKVVKKAAPKKAAPAKTAVKKVSKQDENIYFWSGILIAICAAGAFMVLAFGIGSVIR